jgi:hypothetical protein
MTVENVSGLNNRGSPQENGGDMMAVWILLVFLLSSDSEVTSTEIHWKFTVHFAQ